MTIQKKNFFKSPKNNNNNKTYMTYKITFRETAGSGILGLGTLHVSYRGEEEGIQTNFCFLLI